MKFNPLKNRLKHEFKNSSHISAYSHLKTLFFYKTSYQKYLCRMGVTVLQHFADSVWMHQKSISNSEFFFALKKKT